MLIWSVYMCKFEAELVRVKETTRRLSRFKYDAGLLANQINASFANLSSKRRFMRLDE